MQRGRRRWAATELQRHARGNAARQSPGPSPSMGIVVHTQDTQRAKPRYARETSRAPPMRFSSRDDWISTYPRILGSSARPNEPRSSFNFTPAPSRGDSYSNSRPAPESLRSVTSEVQPRSTPSAPPSALASEKKDRRLREQMDKLRVAKRVVSLASRSNDFGAYASPAYASPASSRAGLQSRDSRECYLTAEQRTPQFAAVGEWTPQRLRGTGDSSDGVKAPSRPSSSPVAGRDYTELLACEMPFPGAPT